MGDIIITYYGHSCFKASCDKGSVIFDPYENNSVPGLRLPENLAADMVLCSHSHSDHNASGLVSSSGNNCFDVDVVTVPHDNEGGAKRGMNDISIVHMDGKRIAHFGDIGRMPTSSEYDILKGLDLAMIPVGGFFTIDIRQALDIVRCIKPKKVIFMHFRRDDTGYNVLSDIDQLDREYDSIRLLPQSEIALSDLPHNACCVLTAMQ